MGWLIGIFIFLTIVAYPKTAVFILQAMVVLFFAGLAFVVVWFALEVAPDEVDRLIYVALGLLGVMGLNGLVDAIRGT